jgi:hypothetical protein
MVRPTQQHRPDWAETAEQFDQLAREADHLGSLDLPFLSSWEFFLPSTKETRAKLRLIVGELPFPEGHFSHCEGYFNLGVNK